MNDIDCPFTRRLDALKQIHHYCLTSIKARHLEVAFEKACKMKHLLQLNLDDLNTLIEVLNAKIQSNDNEPILFDKEELETKTLWVD